MNNLPSNAIPFTNYNMYEKGDKVFYQLTGKRGWKEFFDVEECKEYLTEQELKYHNFHICKKSKH